MFGQCIQVEGDQGKTVGQISENRKDRENLPAVLPFPSIKPHLTEVGLGYVLNNKQLYLDSPKVCLHLKE